MSSDWKKRDQAAKRARAIKAALLADATGRLDRLWAASNVENSQFTPSERKAIADAGHSIRSITGGWLGRGRR